MEAFEESGDNAEFEPTERTSDFSTSERILSGRIVGLSVRIVFHEIRGNDPRYAFAFCFTEAAKLLCLHTNYLHRLILNLDLRAALKKHAESSRVSMLLSSGRFVCVACRW